MTTSRKHGLNEPISKLSMVVSHINTLAKRVHSVVLLDVETTCSCKHFSAVQTLMYMNLLVYMNYHFFL